MAITIKVEPQEYQSTYNEVILVLDSTKKAEDKFQYVLDIDVNGVYSSRIKVQSNPAGYGVINISKHLESYISYNFDLADKEAFKKIINSYGTYDVAFSEEYVLETAFTSVSDNGGFCQYNYAAAHNFVLDDFVTVSASSVPAYDGIQEVTAVPTALAIVTTEVFSATATGSTVLSNGTVTIIPDAVTMTGSKFMFNGVLQWLDVPDWDYTDYLIDSTGAGKLLTTLPKTSTTDLEDRQTINLYQNLANEAEYLQVTSDNRGTFFLDNDFNTITSSTNFLSIGVGGFDINNAPLSATAASSVPPIIDGETKSYTIKTVDLATFAASSEEYTFLVNHCKPQYEGVRLMYLNRFGSFNSFNFSLASSKQTRVKKTTFKQNYGSYDSVANSYGWASSDRGDTRLDTDIREDYSINSDYISEEEGNLIEELIASPEVYHLAENTYVFDTPLAISTHSIVGGFYNIRTAVAHNLNIGDTVKLAGYTDGTYNKELTVLSISGTTNAVLNKPITVLPTLNTAETVAKQIFSADGVLRAVNVDTNSVKIKKRITDRLINYSLKYSYSNKNIVQR